ncbi:MAG: hypothetical protein ABSF00_13815, partial [Candidatus Bathyarchaeia archaeon]
MEPIIDNVEAKESPESSWQFCRHILKLQRSPESRLKLPISRNEFEKLKAIGPTLEEEVLDFLSKN